MPHPRTTARLAAVALAASALIVTATGRAAHAADSATKVAATFDPVKTTLTGFPSSLKGGLTTMSVTQPATGTYGVQVHLVRLDATKTDAEFRKAIRESVPSWVTLFGGTSTVRPGKTRTVTVNLPKGNYVWSVDSSGEELNEASPLGHFTVGGAAAGVLPKGAATLVMKEYGFETTGLKAGVNTVSYSNAGKEVHFTVMFRLMPGKTLADLQKAMAADAPPPAGLLDDALQNGGGFLASGGKQAMDIELTAGKYVFVCFAPDKTGKPHFMLGMVKEVIVA